MKPRIRISTDGQLSICFTGLDINNHWEHILTGYSQAISGDKDRFVLLPQAMKIMVHDPRLCAVWHRESILTA